MTVEHHHKHKDDETLLERSLRKAADFAKTPPSRTTWLVLVCLALAGTLIGVWFYFTATAAASSSTLWTGLDLTGRADLQKFAQEANHQNTVQGRWAQVRAARLDMQDVSLLGGSNSDRDRATTEIEEARSIYQKLVQEAGDTPPLMQESLMGLAKSNEIRGDLDKAKQYYDQLARDYPKTVLGQEAQERSKALDDPDVKDQVQTLAAEFAAPK